MAQNATPPFAPNPPPPQCLIKLQFLNDQSHHMKGVTLIAEAMTCVFAYSWHYNPIYPFIHPSNLFLLVQVVVGLERYSMALSWIGGYERLMDSMQLKSSVHNTTNRRSNTPQRFTLKRAIQGRGMKFWASRQNVPFCLPTGSPVGHILLTRSQCYYFMAFMKYCVP